MKEKDSPRRMVVTSEVSLFPVKIVGGFPFIPPFGRGLGAAAAIAGGAGGEGGRRGGGGGRG